MKSPLTENEQLFLQIKELTTSLNHVNAYVFTKDKQLRYTYANSKVCQLFNCPLEEIIGKTDETFFDLETVEKLHSNDRRVINNNEHLEFEETNVIKETLEKRIYSCVKTPLHDSENNVIGLCGIASDITIQRSLEEQVAEQTQLIETMLANKSLMMEAATKSLIKNIF